jgi:cysteinyl-tRNA synthetase
VVAVSLLDYKVNWISNITDVGHLTNEELDTGEDKLIKQFNNSGSLFKAVEEVASYYTKSVLEDWKVFNLIEPTHRPKATDYISEMIELIKLLLDKGFAYETTKGIYFDSSKNELIGILSNNNKELLQTANREIVEDNNRLRKADFALWKRDSNHLMRWDSPWGYGYPGWHIECSAMSHKYAPLTIHTGGEDNKFPHHEAEIAQSKYGYEYDLAKCWVHTSHILIDGHKMSKSLGNIINLKDNTYSPMAIKLALMSGKYRKQLNVTKELLESSQRLIDRYNDIYSNSKIGNLNLDNYINSIMLHLANDLNTPLVLAKLHKAFLLIEKHKVYPEDWFKSIENLLGLQFNKKGKVYSAEIQQLIAKRDNARKNKDYVLADKLRQELTNLGVNVKDEKY